MDGPTPKDNSHLARLFVVGTRLILANAWTTILVAVGLAVVASFYTLCDWVITPVASTW